MAGRVVWFAFSAPALLSLTCSRQRDRMHASYEAANKPAAAVVAVLMQSVILSRDHA